jgi:hypothetical protein
MVDIDDLEHRYTVIFPAAKAFAVDDALYLLACAVKHEIHSQILEPLRPFPGKWGQAATYIKAEIEDKAGLTVDLEKPTEAMPPPSELRWLSHENPEYMKKEIIDYKGYLTDRLLKAVKQGKFELRNWTLEKVVEPPGSDDVQVDHSHSYRTLFSWAKMTSILKEDLVIFCSAEKIRVVFENDNPVSLVSEGKQSMVQNCDAHHQEAADSAVDAVQTSTIRRHELIDSDESLLNILDSTGQCNKLTESFSRRLVV